MLYTKNHTRLSVFFTKQRLEFILIAIIVCILTIFGFIFILFHTPTSFWEKSFGFDKFILLLQPTEPTVITTGHASLTDLWKYQASLYELIISALIGINAVTAILAFIYVHGKADEIVNDYIRSDEFNRNLEKAYVDFAPELLDSVTKFENTISEIESMKNELDNQKKNIAIIAHHISQLDDSEEFASNLTLTKAK